MMGIELLGRERGTPTEVFLQKCKILHFENYFFLHLDFYIFFLHSCLLFVHKNSSVMKTLICASYLYLIAVLMMARLVCLVYISSIFWKIQDERSIMRKPRARCQLLDKLQCQQYFLKTILS